MKLKSETALVCLSSEDSMTDVRSLRSVAETVQWPRWPRVGSPPPKGRKVRRPLSDSELRIESILEKSELLFIEHNQVNTSKERRSSKKIKHPRQSTPHHLPYTTPVTSLNKLRYHHRHLQDWMSKREDAFCLSLNKLPNKVLTSGRLSPLRKEKLLKRKAAKGQLLDQAKTIFQKHEDGGTIPAAVKNTFIKELQGVGYLMPNGVIKSIILSLLKFDEMTWPKVSVAFTNPEIELNESIINLIVSLWDKQSICRIRYGGFISFVNTVLAAYRLPECSASDALLKYREAATYSVGLISEGVDLAATVSAVYPMISLTVVDSCEY